MRGHETRELIQLEESSKTILNCHPMGYETNNTLHLSNSKKKLDKAKI